MPRAEVPRIAMQVSRGAVVASIQVDLDEPVLAQFQEDLLGRVQEAGSRWVVLDVSGLETLDSEEFAALRRIIVMARLMGARSVLVGLRPGIASSLIEVGADVDGLEAATDLDAAFELIQPQPVSEDAEADAAEPEGDPDLAAPEAESLGGSDR